MMLSSGSRLATKLVLLLVAASGCSDDGGSNASQFANGYRAPVTYDGSRISQERLGYAFDGTLPTLGGVKAGIVYDLYVKQLSNM